MQQESTQFMNRCLELAEKALQNGDPPVGCVIIHDHKIIGEGVESGRSTGDITNHAEILAIRDAISNGFEYDLASSTLVTTHEPCVMCSYVIRHHQIPTIIYGLSVDQTGGHTSRFNLLGTEDVKNWKRKPKIIGGIWEDRAAALSKRFKDKFK